MVSRAQHLKEQRDGQTVHLSLLTLACAHVERLECLRPDGIGDDYDAIFNGLAQFDILSNIVAVIDNNEASGRTFYPNFARFRQNRIQPIVDRLLIDDVMRAALGVEDDERLAVALKEIGSHAASEGVRFDGFDGWNRTPVAAFIAKHLPPKNQSQ